MSDGKPDHAERHAPWRRWQMGELQSGRPQAGGGEAPPAEAAQVVRQRQAARRQAELDALREQVIREAREEGYHAGLEEGRREGLAQGLQEGRQQAAEELDKRTRETLAPLAPLAEQFSAALAALDESIADELVELALATGRQLAGEALKSRPRQVLELVRALLHTEPPLTGQQRLWLHPLDHKLVEQHLGEELAAAGWTLQPDDQLSRGGCRVTSASGELDATWESRWKSVKAQVRRRRPSTQTTDDD
ncbi:flagellar assembly protein FliH [Halomonas campisalis]|uniref:Flagellar assembly protein FliH n=1 Tax=Billgrantia campisalis TaxID=74661 RepID=A0ABS9P3R3_9GAMM|nr:flagellar assembly protein FliH [Halomonas campisalis]MCG6656246.1 flagellar assembly protein FliH [Halomonas campisalis]MDR5861433.1 flagellar assembly protein FliH [Halomonas campisalis]